MKKLFFGFLSVCALSAFAGGDGTIAYWTFGEQGLDDVSGNGHALTAVGGADPTSGYLRLNQDGFTGQFLKTTSSLDLSQEDQVTFECWFRAAGHPTGDSTRLLLASATPSAGVGGFLVHYNTSYKMRAQFRHKDGYWQLEDSKTAGFEDSQWHHLAYTIDRSVASSGSCRMYIDGVEQTDSAFYPSLSDRTMPALFNDVFFIGGGAEYYKDRNFWVGDIDDVRISRGVLSTDEFLQAPTLNADGSSAIAYWPFGSRGGVDVTGNGNDLSVSNVTFLSGVPVQTWSGRDKEKWLFSTSNSLSFALCQRTGLTVECYFKTDSGANGNLLELADYYYQNPGAFRIRYEGESDGRIDVNYR